ncbi:vWA domain-containing protein [Deinococcus cellulosilyticus]|uniref:VWFA domain-containing protein n=1 Tax=Deinococcus cellulosilyticus (strain DSM 18568 / NBRC 106333 / KACC 11606 / 5516J-15) TaxID=1223518 RepID=A0A511N135_DEIC1|nr:VWA domain-containing protein [Deinococcus cellulosilyticus]GEM46570.1 hypothetical protein DC3_22050 [Deinococcus cellulosilyticus NBRC 106333 = KACC 11606]
MLDVTHQLHRDHLLAHTGQQKLFLLLTLKPGPEAIQARPPLAVAFVVDTSGSMRENVTASGKGRNKMDLVIESLRGILMSGMLGAQDRVSLVQFDDRASVVLPMTSSAQRARLMAGIERLDWHTGGTHMGAGMGLAREALEGQEGSVRMVLLTDGQTSDEALVRSETQKFAAKQIPVTTVGVGDEVNTDLLMLMTDQTQGKPIDVVPDTHNPQPPAVRASDLPAVLLGDLRQSLSEVVTRVSLSVKTVKDVVLERVTRVHPTQTEVDIKQQPMSLGNLAGQAGATFILEFTLPVRPPARIRLAQLGITFQVPGAQFTGELPPIDVVAEFTQNEEVAGRLKPEVMRFVQQRNIEGMLSQAIQEAQKNPQQAQKTLQMAREVTERLGSRTMTQALDRALQEIGQSKTLSAGTAKTLRIGSKTQTVKTADVPLTDEEIRRISGT